MGGGRGRGSWERGRVWLSARTRYHSPWGWGGGQHVEAMMEGIRKRAYWEWEGREHGIPWEKKMKFPKM